MLPSQLLRNSGNSHFRLLLNIVPKSRFLSSTRYASSDTQSIKNYSVEEVRILIPTTGNYLAGKLWKANNEGSSNKSESQTPKVPIIAVHGFQDTCGSFDPLIPLILKNGLEVFAMDIPGHGHSYHTKELYYHFTVDTLSCIKRVLRHFNWKKATLLGHSMGAVMSSIFCASYPNQVEKFIALDNVQPPSVEDVIPSIQSTVDRIFEVEEKLMRKPNESTRPSYTFDEILKKTMESRRNTVSEEGCRILLERGAAEVQGESGRYRFTHDIKTTIPTAFRVLNFEQVKLLTQRIKCPVCFIKGVPGEIWDTEEVFNQKLDILSQSVPYYEYHEIPGNHHFHLNDPHLVAPVIINFLK